MPAIRTGKIFTCDCKLKNTWRNKNEYERHMRTAAHRTEDTELFACSYDDCDFVAAQKGAVKRHERTHDDSEASWLQCPASNCLFICKDESGLLRHRVENHGYIPNARRKTAKPKKTSSSKPSTRKRKTKITPPLPPPIEDDVRDADGEFEYDNEYVGSYDVPPPHYNSFTRSCQPTPIHRREIDVPSTLYHIQDGPTMPINSTHYLSPSPPNALQVANFGWQPSESNQAFGATSISSSSSIPPAPQEVYQVPSGSTMLPPTTSYFRGDSMFGQMSEGLSWNFENPYSETDFVPGSWSDVNQNYAGHLSTGCESNMYGYQFGLY